MPSDLTETSTWETVVEVPSDGDGANAESVITPFSQLANRCLYLKDECETIGVQMIRKGNLSAMSALSGMPDGAVFNLVPGGALYTYHQASVLSPDAYLVIAAAGGGNWLHPDALAANGAKGVVCTGVNGGASGKVPASVIPFATIAVLAPALTLSGSVVSGSGVYVDIDGMTMNVPSCAVGDVLSIAMQVDLATDGSAGFGAIGVFKGVILDGVASVDTALRRFEGDPTAGRATQAVIVAMHTVTTAGTVTVKGQYKIAGGHTMQAFNGSAAIVVTQYRP